MHILYISTKIIRSNCHNDIFLPGTLCRKADQVTLQGHCRTGTAFTAIAQDRQEVPHDAVVTATMAAGLAAHIQRNGLHLLAKAVQDDLLSSHIRHNLALGTKDFQLP